MNRYILIRRLRGPAVLLLLGTLALLHQMGVIPFLWRLFWPLLLIVMGLLMLAERAALASDGYPFLPGVPWQSPSPVANQPATQSTANATSNAGTAIVPSHDFDHEKEGGQS